MVSADPLDVALELHRTGRRAEAEAAYRLVLAGDPHNVSAMHLLGLLCHELRRNDEALPLLLRSVTISPSTPHFHSNLAGVLGRCGRPEEAVPHLREAIRLQPGLPEAHNNLGVALEALERLDEAEAAYREAIRLNPSYAEAYCNLGNVVQKRGPVAAAVGKYLGALDVQCDDPGVLENVATLLGEVGRLEETIACYRKTVALKPEDATAHSSLLFTLHYHPDVDAQQMFSEHVWWGERHAAPLRGTWLPHENDRTPGRRLRVGYVSPDFRGHPVSRFFEPILRGHDRAGFEVTCYSDVKEPDAVTRRLCGMADAWRETRGIPDGRLAELIRQDRIDILVDLTGHMLDHRLLVFARKPAPVQVSYIGYPNTTGVAAIDYRVTDSIHDPPGRTERYHVEKLVRLDPCCWCYQPDEADERAPRQPPPSARNGYVTFACLNRLIKATPMMIGNWSKILSAVPCSRLMVLTGPSDVGAKGVKEAFAAHGVDPTRLEPVARIGRERYMDLWWRQVDINLDTYPYNGHTTTCDALWMGVPTVTLAGSTHVSRAGMNVLTQVGLGDLVTSTAEQYVDVAVGLARDDDRRSALRAGLRDRVKNSPLFAGSRLCKQLERAYRAMWNDWCKNPEQATL